MNIARLSNKPLKSLYSLIDNHFSSHTIHFESVDYIGIDFDDTIVRSQYRKLSIISAILSSNYSIKLDTDCLKKLNRLDIVKLAKSKNTKIVEEDLICEINDALLKFYKELIIPEQNINFLNQYIQKCEIITAGRADEIAACLKKNCLSNLKIVFTPLDKSKVLLNRKAQFKSCLFIGDSDFDELSAKISKVDFVRAV